MAHDAPIRASPRGDIRHDKIRRVLLRLLRAAKAAHPTGRRSPWGSARDNRSCTYKQPTSPVLKAFCPLDDTTEPAALIKLCRSQPASLDQPHFRLVCRHCVTRSCLAPWPVPPAVLWLQRLLEAEVLASVGLVCGTQLNSLKR